MSSNMPALRDIDMSTFKEHKPAADHRAHKFPSNTLASAGGLNDTLRAGLEAARLYRAVDKVLNRQAGYREVALTELEQVLSECVTLRSLARGR